MIYSHQFYLPFTVENESPDAGKVTAEEMRQAVYEKLKEMQSLPDSEVEEMPTWEDTVDENGLPYFPQAMIDATPDANVMED
jgi:hypothetical protein